MSVDRFLIDDEGEGEMFILDPMSATVTTAFDDAQARAIAWLTAWDGQGVHRTATSGDEAGALWLAREAASLGGDVTTEIFALDRLEPIACYLELDGERIEGVPAFDAPGTDPNGITGALGLGDMTRGSSSPS
jgi:hypothetical protein